MTMTPKVARPKAGRFGGRAVVVAVVLALVAVACSSDDEPTSVTPSTSATTTSSTVAATTTTTAAATSTSAPPSTTVVTEPTPAFLWEDVTSTALPGSTEGTWSNKVELADIDGDGDVDMLFAEGGQYSAAGVAVINQAWINDGNAVFSDVSEQVFGSEPGYTRAIKARDLDGDGMLDIVMAGTWGTQSRLLLNRGGLVFEDVTATHLPDRPASSGDVEAGDVDGDGDLDLVLSDWGEEVPTLGAGVTMLWLNDGEGRFVDATATHMPDVPVAWSWELELVDVDNDFDLDIAISCKTCSGSYLFHNDGTGVFSDATELMPQFKNNYDFEAMDLTGDGFLDLVTLNDFVQKATARFANHVFVADGLGGFLDATAELLPDSENPSADDNMAAFVDFDSDGDADVFVGNLGPRDRLLVNDGAGNLTMLADVLGGEGTGGVLGVAFADLNGDSRIDLVQSQGEIGDMTDRVFLGALVEPDTAPPVVGIPVVDGRSILVRVHDNKSPLMPHDWTEVVVGGADGTWPLMWYGEYLWRSPVLEPGNYQVCAVDAAGNEACADEVEVS